MTEFDKVVGQRLRAGVQSGEHPDANLLSAFVERSLPSGERERVSQHLSTCRSCRDTVTTALPPETDFALIVLQKEAAQRPVWLKAALSLFAACVIAAVVTMAAKQKHELARNDSSAVESTRQRAFAPAQDPTTPNVQADDRSKANGAKAPSTRQARNPAAGTPTVIAEAKPDENVVPGRAKDAAERSIESSSITVNRNIHELKPSSTLPRWTLGSDGKLQRSLDSGASWRSISVARGVTLRALAANGRDIWVGGAQGALFHSADAGEHWTRIQPTNSGQALASDIIGVEFTDRSHGTVMTSSKEIWTTADAGLSWDKK